MIFFFLVNLGTFIEIFMDIILSSDDDDVACPLEPDVLVV
jgi:hypothetical protein